MGAGLCFRTVEHLGAPGCHERRDPTREQVGIDGPLRGRILQGSATEHLEHGRDAGVLRLIGRRSGRSGIDSRAPGGAGSVLVRDRRHLPSPSDRAAGKP